MDDSTNPPDPASAYDANGVDRTLVRAVLRMTPAERVRSHDLLLADILALEAAGRAARDGRTMETRYGVLDVLGTIEEATTYDDVVPATELVDLGGFSVRALGLERLLEVKKKLSRPKDQLMALQIEATLDERRKSRT